MFSHSGMGESVGGGEDGSDGAGEDAAGVGRLGEGKVMCRM